MKASVKDGLVRDSGGKKGQAGQSRELSAKRETCLSCHFLNFNEFN